MGEKQQSKMNDFSMPIKNQALLTLFPILAMTLPGG